jgi:sec-independent protein translocase protein TatA
MPLGFIGPWEAVIIIVIIVFLFGAKRLGPALRSVGTSAKEFKKAVTDEDDAPPRALPPAKGERKTD